MRDRRGHIPENVKAEFIELVNLTLRDEALRKEEVRIAIKRRRASAELREKTDEFLVHPPIVPALDRD